jgi:hypothetical protein
MMVVPLCRPWWSGHRWGAWEVFEMKRSQVLVEINGTDERVDRGILVRQRRKCGGCGYEQYDEQTA